MMLPTSYLYKILLVWALILAFFIVEQSLRLEKQRNNDISHTRINRDINDVSKPLLTLFTSANTSNAFRRKIHENTLLNWASLLPWIRPVLYTLPEDADFAEVARDAGWDTQQVLNTRNNLPTIAHLFSDVIERYPNSRFYGFSNADIIFDHKLVETLKKMATFDFKEEGVLLIGKRTNVPVRYIKAPAMTEGGEGLEELLHHGQPAGDDTQDYFITTTEGFPWGRVPDFVLGKPGYDNWLVVQALIWGVEVVDLSQTINAVHQSGADGDRSGWSTQEVCINRDIAGPFDYRAGQISCSTWYTTRDWGGEVVLIERTQRLSRCIPKPVTPHPFRDVPLFQRINNKNDEKRAQDNDSPPERGHNPCRY